MRLAISSAVHILSPCIAINQYLTHYCVVRADLPFGVQAAQLIHAAGYSIRSPIPDGTYAVALHAADEREVRALAQRLHDAGIEHTLIVEEDAPYACQAMAIGIAPCERRKLKPYLSKYALVAQPGRALGVMTREVQGSNPCERAI
jgi:hypothetical protein